MGVDSDRAAGEGVQRLLERVDIYVRCVRNRRGEVPSPNGLGDPTPAKDHASVHAPCYLVALKYQQNLAIINEVPSP